MSDTSLSDVTVVYRSAGEPVTALHGVGFAAGPGSVTVLAGPSGSGKSTMLRLLAGFDRPTSGEVTVDGVDILALSDGARRRFRRRRVAVVHQRPSHNLLAELTAEEHVSFARQVRHVAGGGDVLDRFALGGRRRALPQHLSGGEQQRLAMAMAVASGTMVVLADEPTAELDRSHAHEVVEALQQMAGEGLTVVVASHDADLVAAMPAVVRLADGRVVE